MAPPNNVSKQRIRAVLAPAAIRAGIRDLDALKLLDLSSVTFDANGAIRGADAFMADARKQKPHLFAKHARDMSPAEYEAAKAALLG